MTRLLRLVLALVVGLLVAAAGTSPAAAHAQLIESDPADGSVVASAPDTVTLTFNEPVRLERARIFAADGTELDVDARSSDSVVTIDPQDDLGEGTVVVSWELESADGHVVSGALSFSVGAPSAGSTGTTGSASGTDAGPDATAAAVLGLLGAAVAVAGLLLRRPVLVRGGWTVAVAAAVLWLPLQTGGGLRESASWLDGALSWRGLLLVGTLAGLAGVVSAGRRATLALGAVVLVAAGTGLVVVPGPTTVAPAGAAPAAGPQELMGGLGAGTVTAVVDRADGGSTTLELSVVDEAGEPVAPVAVPAVRFRSADLDIGPIVLEEAGPGAWTGTATLPTAGEWTLEISVRITEFDNPVVDLPFTIEG
ncbi:copper resistance CopC family protein [Nocardioides sp. CCNWLW216]|uniref:copper resistance CopC family protein n=1 Tax=Nocardioides sp. CCNWLW216 TaxID=3125803 RepID=UPI0030152350